MAVHVNCQWQFTWTATSESPERELYSSPWRIYSKSEILVPGDHFPTPRVVLDPHLSSACRQHARFAKQLEINGFYCFQKALSQDDSGWIHHPDILNWSTLPGDHFPTSRVVLDPHLSSACKQHARFAKQFEINGFYCFQKAVSQDDSGWIHHRDILNWSILPGDHFPAPGVVLDPRYSTDCRQRIRFAKMLESIDFCHFLEVVTHDIPGWIHHPNIQNWSILTIVKFCNLRSDPGPRTIDLEALLGLSYCSIVLVL